MSIWQPIGAAPHDAGIEIIGCCWGLSASGHYGMTRTPFVSFWSPTHDRFFHSPTHYTPMPDAPRKGAA